MHAILIYVQYMQALTCATGLGNAVWRDSYINIFGISSIT